VSIPEGTIYNRQSEFGRQIITVTWQGNHDFGIDGTDAEADRAAPSFLIFEGPWFCQISEMIKFGRR